MGEQSPLLIRYISDKDKGVFFGWSIRGLDQIDPYRLPIYSPESRKELEAKGQNLTNAVHEQVLLFFNGALSADLNIPPNYPYSFFEPDNDKPAYTGQLRKK